MAGLLLSGGLGLTLACGTIAATPSDGGFKGGAPCPTSLAENGEACDAPESLVCTAAIPCLPSAQQANCSCVGGKWQCSYDARGGGIILPGSKPKCFDESDAPGVCPAGEPTGIVLCDQPGLVCSYVGVTCSGSGTPNIDTCQCAPTNDLTESDGGITNAIDGGLAWSCDRELCNPTSDAMVPPPPDSGTPDTGAGPDGGKDAKVDGS